MSDDRAERLHVDAKLMVKIIFALAGMTWGLILAGWLLGVLAGADTLSTLAWWSPPWIVMIGFVLVNLRRWTP